MANTNSPSTGWLVGSILVAFILSIVPLPHWAAWYRPHWVLLVTIYWLLTCSGSLSLGWVWTIGILLDLLDGVTLGEHALALTAVAYFLLKFNTRVQFFSFWQQMVVIVSLSLLYFLLLLAAQGFVGELPGKGLFWIPFVVTILFWPIVHGILYRQTYRTYER